MIELEASQFITPMKVWEGIGSGTQKTERRDNSEASLFSDIFQNVVGQVYDMQQDVENKQYLLATGQLDDVHTLPIAEMKANLSVDILIGLRNKALEAYNDLMKINM
ncbi:MAG: flagellar hook-basal body complex protein FliE [Lachnospiraceae bacterium]|nr:flagellar hook-basal body complex protein FliE [Lachnospiraceae bacterium]